MVPRLVGVMGKKRHGKDTLAARLTSTHGFTRLAFADPMREALLRIDPLVRVEVDEVGPLAEARGYADPAGVYRLSYLVEHAGWETAKALREVRRLLQEFGTPIRDTLGEDVWVDRTLREAAEIPGPVVITDVRFPNEVEAVRRRGGRLLYVVNPRVPVNDSHISETAVAPTDADAIVWNGGTIADLHRNADAAILR